MAGDYQKIDIYVEHEGKINVTGELSIPELADLVTAPLAENAIGMKDGKQYKWNKNTGLWEAVGSSSESLEVSAATSSADLSKSVMNATYEGFNTVVFTNLTDYPDNVLVAQRIGSDNWFINLYGNKLT